MRHGVKILTIENNSLSDYIDRLKITRPDQNGEGERARRDPEEGEESLLRAEVSRLKQIIGRQESEYESKIDEFITSHKSLAHECKVLEQ